MSTKYGKDFEKYSTYTKEEAKALNDFCKENGIRHIGMEFYFELNDHLYRIAPFTHIKTTSPELVRLPWLPDGAKCENIIFIKANNWQVKEIYTALKEGRPLSTVRRKREVSLEAKPEEKPVVSQKVNAPVSVVRPNKKQEALNSLLGGKRK